MKCNSCKNYLSELDSCLFCSYQRIEDYSSSFDIFNLDEDRFDYLGIMKHLRDNGVECLTVDTWFDMNLMIIVGCNAYSERVADVLKVHREVVYDWSDNGLIIVNLFQEKYLRGELE